MTDRNDWAGALVHPAGSVNLSVTLSVQSRRISMRDLTLVGYRRIVCQHSVASPSRGWCDAAFLMAEWCGQAVLGKAAALSVEGHARLTSPWSSIAPSTSTAEEREATMHPACCYPQSLPKAIYHYALTPGTFVYSLHPAAVAAESRHAQEQKPHNTQRVGLAAAD